MSALPTGSTQHLNELADDDLLTLVEVADILRVPISTMRWWRQLGEGPVFFKIGRHLLTTAADVRAYIDAARLDARHDARGDSRRSH